MNGDPWDWLARISSGRQFTGGPADVPFWGGFVGYFSYELGLNQIGITPHKQTVEKTDEDFDYDDMSLLYSTETIVYNIPMKTVYLISLNRDAPWIEQTRALLHNQAATANGFTKSQQVPFAGRIVHPNKNEYLHRIEMAQERIRAGDSYELCLTATTHIHDLEAEQTNNKSPRRNEGATASKRTQKNANLFNHLRSTNPAAYMSFLQLNGMTLLSASPEEFLNFDASTRTARMRPIKGTLSKFRPDGKTPVSLSEAETELHNPKTVAENLMILDLIRNDLAKVSAEVKCPKPLWVEEISNMYQLVSTIEARVDPGVTAWDLLKATLPPGSMTGAPKRRSCEILQELEGLESSRGVYSGIVGYVDVRGHSRTSVNIRNIARYPGEDVWRVGAGGAITCLSDPVAEWEERQLKTRGVCGIFEGDFGVLETMRWDPEYQQVNDAEAHAARMSESLRFFGFNNALQYDPAVNGVPASNHNGNSPNRNQRTHEALALSKLVHSHLNTAQKSQNLRISLAIGRSGTITRFDALPISPTGPSKDPAHTPHTSINESDPTQSIQVRLDPASLHIPHFEPFIAHKTTHRAHYNAARERAGVTGRAEVLMFSSATEDASTRQHGDGDTPRDAAPEDLLTEGSYTNVAVFDPGRSVWVTPASGCLRGIERQRLLDGGVVVEGDVTRRRLWECPRIWLFNSVRGGFWGFAGGCMTCGCVTPFQQGVVLWVWRSVCERDETGEVL